MSSVLRAEHLGSLLRPHELLRARESGADPERLRLLEDEHIRRVIKIQKEIGFAVCTDGEFRRGNFMSDFMEAVEGFDLDDGVTRAFKAGVSGGAAPVARVAGVVVSKLRKARSLTARELPFLLENSPGAVKVTVPSATQWAAVSYKYGVTDKVYKDPSAMLQDVVGIMKEELAHLAKQDVQYIQIDAPRYSYYLDPKWREWLKTELRVDPAAALEEAVRADNECIAAARRPGLTIGIHFCRGNNRSHWFASGGYDAIAERLFGTIAADRLLLEYDDERSGSFEPLRFVPKGKTVVLGLVSTKLPTAEDGDALRRRIDDASRFVPLEDLALSPQCGFASVAEGNQLSEDEQWAKLRLVVDVARQVWG